MATLNIHLPVAPCESLSSSSSDWRNNDTQALSAIAPLLLYPIECAGRAYLQFLLLDRKVDSPAARSPSPSPSIPSTTTTSSATASSSSLRLSSSVESLAGLNFNDEKWEKLRQKNIDLGDYYGLLGLEDKTIDASDDDIRRAYRVLSLVCHPDKAKPENRSLAEERFKSMQQGFETLTDPVRRRAYDSQLEFDDSIPKEKEGTTDKTFFTVYSPVFKRNERFSVVKPCPSLGDMNTANDTVHAFYDFWLSFKSWRDFSYLNEHKVEEAQSREEKRMFIRENEKKQAGKKKEEIARVRRLVEDAMRKDPRLVRMKQEEAANKFAKKQQKALQAKQREEEERLAKAAEEARLAEQQQKAAQQAALDKEMKQKLKSFRSYFGKYSREAGFKEEQIELLRSQLTLEQLNAVITHFKQDKDSIDGKALFQQYYLEKTESELERHQRAEQKKAEELYAKKKQQELNASQQHVPWTAGEEALLTKAIIRYPGGVQQRWEKITEMINSHMPHEYHHHTNTDTHHHHYVPRTVKEVLRKQKEMELGMGAVSVGEDEAYAKYLAKMKGDKEHDLSTRVKGLSISEAAAVVEAEERETREREAKLIESERRRVEGERQAMLDLEKDKQFKESERRETDQAKEAKKKEKKEKEAVDKPATKTIKDKAEREQRMQEIEQKQQQQQKQTQKQAQTQTNQRSSVEKAPANESKVEDQHHPSVQSSISSKSDDWNADEQAALENALKNVNKDAPDRWDLIAKTVQTKNKKQCVARFKHIREQILKQKETQS